MAALDLRLGIVEGYWTQRAAEQASWVVTQMTPEKAEELFARVGNMEPSKSSLDRLPKALMIGSGVVEAACKTLVAQRLKLSGMRWSSRGAQAILTMRGWDQSERFDEAWALVAATYQREVHVLAKVIDITPKPERKTRAQASG
jgi:hypothetical protein